MRPAKKWLQTVPWNFVGLTLISMILVDLWALYSRGYNEGVIIGGFSFVQLIIVLGMGRFSRKTTSIVTDEKEDFLLSQVE